MPAGHGTTGKCYTYGSLKFYAKNGFICLHDEETGEFFVLTRKEFLQRAQAISDEAKRLRTIAAENPGKAAWLSADRAALQRAIEDMIAVTKEAKEQGDRNDPVVDAWFMRHRPGRKSKISMASGANFTTALPGALPVGKDTGKQVTPDFSVGAPAKKLILPGDF
ncbi:MAG: hypothetical protein EBT15_09030 [Betaproteobacteria bacterium]|nr:hypothetical protein [Betaproteobacteria bacterium]